MCGRKRRILSEGLPNEPNFCLHNQIEIVSVPISRASRMAIQSHGFPCKMTSICLPCCVTSSATRCRLGEAPVRLPMNWIEWVNEPLTDHELNHLRGCVNRQRPFGEVGWVELTARALGLTSSLHDVGRPSRN